MNLPTIAEIHTLFLKTSSISIDTNDYTWETTRDEQNGIYRLPMGANITISFIPIGNELLSSNSNHIYGIKL